MWTGGLSHSSKIWCYHSVASNCKSCDLTNTTNTFNIVSFDIDLQTTEGSFHHISYDKALMKHSLLYFSIKCYMKREIVVSDDF